MFLAVPRSCKNLKGLSPMSLKRYKYKIQILLYSKYSGRWEKLILSLIFMCNLLIRPRGPRLCSMFAIKRTARADETPIIIDNSCSTDTYTHKNLNQIFSVLPQNRHQSQTFCIRKTYVKKLYSLSISLPSKKGIHDI